MNEKIKIKQDIIFNLIKTNFNSSSEMKCSNSSVKCLRKEKKQTKSIWNKREKERKETDRERETRIESRKVRKIPTRERRIWGRDLPFQKPIVSKARKTRKTRKRWSLKFKVAQQSLRRDANTVWKSRSLEVFRPFYWGRVLYFGFLKWEGSYT